MRINPGGGVQPFVGIGIRKEPAFAESILFTGGQTKIINAACGLELFPLMEDGLLRIDRKTRRPERIGDVDMARAEFQHNEFLIEL
jgi:hypothetical protein